MNRRKLTIRKDDNGLFIKTNGRKYRPDYNYQANTILNKNVIRDKQLLGLFNNKPNPNYEVGDKVFLEDNIRSGGIFGDNISVEDIYISNDNLKYLQWFNWVDESKFS